MHRIRKKGLVTHGVRLETHVTEMVEDVAGGVSSEFCSGEVRVQGKGAEVGRDGGVGGRG